VKLKSKTFLKKKKMKIPIRNITATIALRLGVNFGSKIIPNYGTPK